MRKCRRDTTSCRISIPLLIWEVRIAVDPLFSDSGAPRFAVAPVVSYADRDEYGVRRSSADRHLFTLDSPGSRDHAPA
jgi:hypothetical protein